jgi:hypothetical protein
MNGTRTRERLQLVGASGGAIFAVLTFVAYLVHAGPSSDEGVAVVGYYSTHGTATLMAAALVGVAAIGFIWFAETFAGRTPLGAVGVAGASVTAALYLVSVGCWEILAEIFGGVALVNVPSEGYSNAHMLYVAGNGASHMGNFGAAAFVGATAAAMVASTAPRRWLGWLGVGVAAFRVTSAVIELTSNSHWSDVVSIAGFLAFLAWVFAASVALLLPMGQRATSPASTQAAATSATTTS